MPRAGEDVDKGDAERLTRDAGLPVEKHTAPETGSPTAGIVAWLAETRAILDAVPICPPGPIRTETVKILCFVQLPRALRIIQRYLQELRDIEAMSTDRLAVECARSMQAYDGREL